MKTILLVFLKLPQPGSVKTRLAQAIGPDAAALVYRRLVRDVLKNVEQVAPEMTVRVLFDPPGDEEAIRSWILGLWSPAETAPEFAAQLEGDLGDRLRHAFREAFAEGFDRVLAIGTDCASLTAATLREARDALDQAEVVFGPASDGGYYLIGCTRFEARLFDVPWSSETTLRTSLARAAETGLTTRQLAPLTDIDTVYEWEAYKEEILQRTPVPPEPIVFSPLYQERVWGGRRLETRYGRELPDDGPIGEAWELVDRPEAQSLVAEGPFAGLALEDLWTLRRPEIFGADLLGDRFPLLLKILDAREDLSLQVHPPESVAPDLDGEAKTEMWYVAEAEPGARIYAGIKEGVTPEAFRAALEDGTAASLVHVLEPREGDVLFIPSGRLHAIGAGLLIFEIQENSDTTYRVFDWNRVGLDGSPRQLHVEEAMRCIDFDDIEPSASRSEGENLVRCRQFQVRQWTMPPHQTRAANDTDRFAIITVARGCVQCHGRLFHEGDFFLIPACAAHQLDLRAGEDGASLLHTTVPEGWRQRTTRLEISPRRHSFYRSLRSRVVEWAESRTGSRHPWLNYVLLAPDFFHLLINLAADREVPGKFKGMLAGAIAYFILPLDLFPEALAGPAGYLDDLALAVFAVNQLINHVNPDVIRRHWAGEGDALELARSIVARADEMIGSGLVRKLRKRFGF